MWPRFKFIKMPERAAGKKDTPSSLALRLEDISYGMKNTATRDYVEMCVVEIGNAGSDYLYI